MGSCSCWLNSFETLLKHLNTLNIYINKSLKPSHLRSQRYNIVSTTATWTERPIHASPPQFRNCFRNNEQTLVSVLGKENSSSALLSVISNWQFCYVLPFTSSSSLSAALPQLSIFLTLSSLFWSSMAFSNTYVTTHSNTHTQTILFPGAIGKCFVSTCQRLLNARCTQYGTSTFGPKNSKTTRPSRRQTLIII